MHTRKPLAVATAAVATLLLASIAWPASAAEPAASNEAQGLPQDTMSIPLEGTPWRVEGYRWRDVERTSGPEVAAWISLASGKVSGSGGCHRIVGRYGTVGQAIAFDMTDPKDHTCAEQTMLVELGLLDGLARARAYRVSDADDLQRARLRIHDDSGAEVLSFRIDDSTRLEVDEWRLVAYSMGTEWVPADATHPAVLTFTPEFQRRAQRRADGEALGSTGCNGLVADYYQYASVISFGKLSVTDAPCPPSLEAQQEAIIGVLDATALSLELLSDRLILASAENGQRLEYVASQPLEDSTWLLSSLSGRAMPRSQATLRLQDGELNGEGPCGAYFGRYSTNGLLLSFSEVTGKPTPGCEDAKRHRQFLEALRTTTHVDRINPRLGFRDALGRTVARFEDPSGP